MLALIGNAVQALDARHRAVYDHGAVAGDHDHGRETLTNKERLARPPTWGWRPGVTLLSGYASPNNREGASGISADRRHFENAQREECLKSQMRLLSGGVFSVYEEN